MAIVGGAVKTLALSAKKDIDMVIGVGDGCFREFEKSSCWF